MHAQPWPAPQPLTDTVASIPMVIFVQIPTSIGCLHKVGMHSLQNQHNGLMKTSTAMATTQPVSHLMIVPLFATHQASTALDAPTPMVMAILTLTLNGRLQMVQMLALTAVATPPWTGSDATTKTGMVIPTQALTGPSMMAQTLTLKIQPDGS